MSSATVDVNDIITDKLNEAFELVPSVLTFGDESGNRYEDMGEVPLDNGAKRMLLSACIREDKDFHTVVLDTITRGLEISKLIHGAEEQYEPEADEEE